MTRLSDEQIHHPTNAELLSQATKIQEEREMLQGRLEKLESSRDGISASVYQRVKADYIGKIKQATEQLAALRKNLEEEQTVLVEKKILIEGACKSGKEKIEESTLRHALGEFSTEQHETTVREETQEIQRLEKALGEIQSALDRFTPIIDQAVSKPPPPPVSRAKPSEGSEPGTMRFREAQLQTDKVAAPAVPQPESAPVPQILVMDHGKVAQTIPIDHTIQIGRSPANDIVLKEAKVSRKHAEIQIAAGKYVLIDCESSNGTFVGGKKITEHVLSPNDEIRIGSSSMVFKA